MCFTDIVINSFVQRGHSKQTFSQNFTIVFSDTIHLVSRKPLLKLGIERFKNKVLSRVTRPQ